MAKVFELHFNPKAGRKKQHALFDTFCFVPETRTEARLGCLYLVGEMKNILPRDQTLLAELAEIIKNAYYEDCLKAALEKANEFLAQEVRQENTNWLGNLNFAVVSLAPDFSINLSKVGNIKILVFTQGEAFDVGEAPSTTRTFSNVVEAQLTVGDKILVLTKEIFESFNAQGILENLAEIKKPKKLLKEKKKTLRELFGACLLVFVKKERRKIYPRQPKLTKGLLYALILAILLLLGYLLF